MNEEHLMAASYQFKMCFWLHDALHLTRAKPVSYPPVKLGDGDDYMDVHVMYWADLHYDLLIPKPAVSGLNAPCSTQHD